jgi:Ankyrin repeats (3 copies)/MYND finger
MSGNGARLFDAIYHGDLKRVKMICAKPRFDANAVLPVPNGMTTTAVHAAVDYNQPDILRLLAEQKANLDAHDHKGWTPAGAAVVNRRIVCLNTLREMGADMCAMSRHGDAGGDGYMMLQPIHMAAKTGNVSLVKWFISVGGVDIEAKDSMGQTAAHHAALEDKVNVVRALADAGANLKAQTPSGQTPALWACVKGNRSIVHYLVKERGLVLTPRESGAADTAKNILQGKVPTGWDQAAFEDTSRVVKDAVEHMSPEERQNIMSLEKHGDVLEFLADRVCADCKTDGASLRCTRCKTAKYCSRTCQRRHWPSHKLSCVELYLKVHLLVSFHSHHWNRCATTIRSPTIVMQSTRRVAAARPERSLKPLIKPPRRGGRKRTRQ